jgi:hypothetical protein
MTTNQVLFGFGLIVVLAVGSQVLASRLRIPALVILLPVGLPPARSPPTSARNGCSGRRSNRSCRSRWR